MIKFVSDLRQVIGFLHVLRFPPPNKTDRHDIAEILFKVALNTIIKNQTSTKSSKGDNQMSYLNLFQTFNFSGDRYL
jgi:hypothetical protein